MAIVQEYLEYTKKWQREYGERTLVLMQVGSFFEAYSLRKEDGTIYGCDSPYGSNIEEFASINDMTIANKASFVEHKQVVMAGVGVAYIEKYLKKSLELK
jgi:DNA mismatch repair protein MutS